jgi:hypothetical protein
MEVIGMVVEYLLFHEDKTKVYIYAGGAEGGERAKVAV